MRGQAPRFSPPVLAALLSVVAVMALGCGSSSKSSSSTSSSATSGGATTAPAATTAAPATTTAPATGGLSGTWTGQYSGAYQGTFTLNWKQSGSNLTGSIKLSTPASNSSIH